MNKTGKIILAIIIIVIAVLVCYNTFGKNGLNVKEDEKENVVVEENVTVEEENTTVNEVENEVEPENETTVENVVENKEAPKSSATVYESDTDTGSTNKKEEAINLVKEKWGEDSTVSFTCDSITVNGEYIIAVISNEKATVLNYFRVNLDNKTVVVDY